MAAGVGDGDGGRPGEGGVGDGCGGSRGDGGGVAAPHLDSLPEDM